MSYLFVEVYSSWKTNVRETEDAFRLRWNNHKNNGNKFQKMKTTCNSIFVSTFIEEVITDNWEFFYMLD